uniref:Uncharacterized protein n=1 Tax=Mycena chlorophos TaxID=658473 RepID=A0ABQ0LHE9_MYCCL|nr:predicted protein [Mycena chlorophos]
MNNKSSKSSTPRTQSSASYLVRRRASIFASIDLAPRRGNDSKAHTLVDIATGAGCDSPGCFVTGRVSNIAL